MVFLEMLRKELTFMHDVRGKPNELFISADGLMNLARQRFEKPFLISWMALWRRRRQSFFFVRAYPCGLSARTKSGKLNARFSFNKISRLFDGMLRKSPSF